MFPSADELPVDRRSSSSPVEALLGERSTARPTNIPPADEHAPARRSIRLPDERPVGRGAPDRSPNCWLTDE